MRYKDTGAVHLDFYRTLNATITYISEKYGLEFLRDTFRKTARSVYRSIREELVQGSAAQLLCHREYYLAREGGEYSVTKSEDGIELAVSKCPAVDYLKKQGIPLSPHFCEQTIQLNRALSEGTPFDITTEVKRPGECVQKVTRRKS